MEALHRYLGSTVTVSRRTPSRRASDNGTSDIEEPVPSSLDRLRLVGFKDGIEAGERDIIQAVIGEEVEPLAG